MSTNILNKDTTINYSDYNDFIKARAANRLADLKQPTKPKTFLDLSLNEIISNTVLSVVAIFTEILHLIKQKAPLKDYSEVLMYKNRMIYLGIFIVFISMFFMTIFISS
jgi:hypothetical protein